MPASKNKKESHQLAPTKRLSAYQEKLNALREGAALREVVEREMLHEFLVINHGVISEYPLLETQQQTVVEILCARVGHPGYEFIHKHIANFIVLLAHWGKAVKVGDKDRATELQSSLINTETMLIKYAQGIVYAMALITDNFEEVILRHFGGEAMKAYSALIEEKQLDERFWKTFIDTFIASRVDEAHKEILEGEKYSLSKERNFLVIRFLFDDILSKLNPTSQTIENTRLQDKYAATLTGGDAHERASLAQSVLVKGVADLPKAKEITRNELVQAGRIACIDPVSEDFETKYRASKEKQPPEKDKKTIKQEQIEMRFAMDQVLAVGVGAAIAIGRTGDHFFKALREFVPEQIEGILGLARDFSVPTLERILYFLLENHTVHILTETGRPEGGKIQIRSGRARRVQEAEVDALEGMSKIRKKQLFGNDVTREGTLLFKPKTTKQLEGIMSMLSLEPPLQEAVQALWKRAVFRVDIMVLINLELVAKTTTNLSVKLGEILESYGVRKPE